MVNDVPSGQFLPDILHRNAHLHHQYQYVVSQICNLIDSFGLVICLTGDNDFGTFLTYLL